LKPETSSPAALKPANTQYEQSPALRRPVNLSDVPNPANDAEHFAMQERMMADLGINIIWFDHGNYDDIPKILKRII